MNVSLPEGYKYDLTLPKEVLALGEDKVEINIKPSPAGLPHKR